MSTPTSIARRARITTPSDTEIRIERSFDAPRDLVFRAYVEPDLMVRWLGPSRYKLVIDKWDLRPGGQYRYVNLDDDGNEFGFHGRFIEIAPPERIVQTWIFEGAPEAETHQTAEFTEAGGRTTVTSTVRFLSKEHRDGLLASDMESGMNEGYERLDALLRTMR